MDTTFRPVSILRPRFASLIPAVLLAACASGAAPAPETEPAPPAEEAVQLEWKWQEGRADRYRMTTDTEATVTGSMLPDAISTTTHQVIDMTQEVEAVGRDGIARVLFTYDRLEISTGLPGQGEIHWSSDDPEPPEEEDARQIAGLMAALVGKTLTVRVDSRGEVHGVEGAEELLDSMLESLGTNEEGSAFMRETMEGFFSGDTMREIVGQGLLPFPADPVLPGDSWTEESVLTLPMVGGLRQQHTLTLEAVEGDTAVLAMDGTLRMGADSGEEAGAAAMGLPEAIAEMMDIAFETRRGEIGGSVRFDLRDGRMIRQDGTAEIDMTITMTPKGEMAERMEEPIVMDLTSSTRTSYERLDG